MSKTILERKIQSCNQANVRLADDKEDPDIIGCVFMSNGYLVACDLSNNSIKLLDSSFAIKDSLKLPNYPWGVSIIDDNTVIVSIPEKFLLQYVTVFPKLELGKVIKLDRRCMAVEVSGEHIYVSLSSKMSGDGEVRILNRENGQEKRRLGIRASGPPLFFHPNFIAASTGGDKIFVSNFGSQKLICLKADGNIIYQYTNEDLGSPTGVCCDDADNVLVCYYYSDSVNVVSSDAKKQTAFLSSKDGLAGPRSVTYRRSDDTIVIGCNKLNNIFVCQLSSKK